MNAQLDYEADLNPQQREVVLDRQGGPVLVLAGAGSGKTRTLTYRVARLLETGTPPEDILLLTFTNRAAREMMERVEQLVGPGAARVAGGTFHSLAHRLLRRHAARIGRTARFLVLDRGESERLIGGALAAVVGSRRRDPDLPAPGVLAAAFGYRASTQLEWHDALRARFPALLPMADLVCQLHAAYEREKAALDALDFDDLLGGLLAMLEREPDLAARYRGRWTHILVDEYQDTNRVQIELVAHLAGDERNLMAVGDDSQSIYSWRGASSDNVLLFGERFPGARIFRVERNYRSRPAILELANCAISFNPRQYPKRLEPVREDRDAPRLVQTWSTRDQGRFVAERVAEQVADGLAPGSAAVLYRSHFQSVDVQLGLKRAGIPFVLVSGVRFFEQTHVRDVLAFVRLAVNPGDKSAFLHLAEHLPQVGARRAERLWVLLPRECPAAAALRDPAVRAAVPAKAAEGWDAWAALMEELARAAGSPRAMIETVLGAGYREHLTLSHAKAAARLQDLDQLAAFADSFAGVEELLGELALMSNVEADAAQGESGGGGGVWLGTVHQAKGLEWDTVFLAGLNQGVWPTPHALAAAGAMLEEERRLFYVALTRARDRLYLLVPAHRQLKDGELAPLEPSLFVEELDASLYERIRYIGEDQFDAG